jgi:hypothetical protein
VVSLIGIKDMVVVDTGDALLIAPRSEVGKIKEVGDILLKDGYGDVI